MGIVALGEVEFFTWKGFSQIFRKINIIFKIDYAVTNRNF